MLFKFSRSVCNFKSGKLLVAEAKARFAHMDGDHLTLLNVNLSANYV